MNSKCSSIICIKIKEIKCHLCLSGVPAKKMNYVLAETKSDVRKYKQLRTITAKISLTKWLFESYIPVVLAPLSLNVNLQTQAAQTSTFSRKSKVMTKNVFCRLPTSRSPGYLHIISPHRATSRIRPLFPDRSIKLIDLYAWWRNKPQKAVTLKSKMAASIASSGGNSKSTGSMIYLKAQTNRPSRYYTAQPHQHCFT